MQATKPFYLEFQNITKKFPGVTALDDVSFGCCEGEVHALMGENGAGKSTLLKTMAGNFAPTSGAIKVNGQPMTFSNTTDALKSGISIIYQELNMLPESSVAENMFLGQLPIKCGKVDWSKLYEKTAAYLSLLNLNISPKTLVKSLSIGQRQMVEITKALTRDAKIIAFDEPTSSLSSREIDKLFYVISELRAENRVLLYVSHRMEEIFQICDKITVFKDGRYVETFNDAKAVTHETLVKSMVGRDVGDVYGYRTRPHGEIGFEAKNFLAPGVKKPASFKVKRGEVVGFFGLVGAGRSELLKGLFGGTKSTSGTVEIDGKTVSIKTPRNAVEAGLVFCPEDRKSEGILGIHSVRDNINISARRNHLFARCIINGGWEKSNSKKRIAELNVKTPSDTQLLRNLSGGNQQKVILGRWLSESVKCIMLDEPTRGIDVGAKNEIYNIIFNLAESGVSVIFVSSDLPEVLGLADRILVMREGAIVGELSHDEATEEKALALAMIRDEAVA